jgi:hypothetical protein
VNLNLGQKTIDLLRFVSMPDSKDRWICYNDLCRKYGPKPVQRKLEELARRDEIRTYSAFGASGWSLTAKGRAILDALDQRDVAGQAATLIVDPYEEGGEA